MQPGHLTFLLHFLVDWNPETLNILPFISPRYVLAYKYPSATWSTCVYIVRHSFLFRSFFHPRSMLQCYSLTNTRKFHWSTLKDWFSSIFKVLSELPNWCKLGYQSQWILSEATQLLWDYRDLPSHDFFSCSSGTLLNQRKGSFAP